MIGVGTICIAAMKQTAIELAARGICIGGYNTVKLNGPIGCYAIIKKRFEPFDIMIEFQWSYACNIKILLIIIDVFFTTFNLTR